MVVIWGMWEEFTDKLLMMNFFLSGTTDSIADIFCVSFNSDFKVISFKDVISYWGWVVCSCPSLPSPQVPFSVPPRRVLSIYFDRC